MSDSKLLFISMLGEPTHYHVEDYKQLCPSGLEKDWIPAWHGPLAKKYHFDMTGVDVIRGDALPSPDRIGAVILGGTIHGVDEDKFWLKTILTWLRAFRALRRPLLGLCGGHQLIAVNLFKGSRLAQREDGMFFGTHPIRLTDAGKQDPLFDGLTDPPYFHFANHDHILPAPLTDMTVLARTHDSPAVAVDFGYHWYGTQFHPESRKECWKCFFKGRGHRYTGQYRSEHAGARLLENFFKIARNVL